MTTGEAREKLATCIKEIQAAGVEVEVAMGVISVGDSWVDPQAPDARPNATPRPARTGP